MNAFLVDPAPALTPARPVETLLSLHYYMSGPLPPIWIEAVWIVTAEADAQGLPGGVAIVLSSEGLLWICESDDVQAGLRLAVDVLDAWAAEQHHLSGSGLPWSLVDRLWACVCRLGRWMRQI